MNGLEANRSFAPDAIVGAALLRERRIGLLWEAALAAAAASALFSAGRLARPDRTVLLAGAAAGGAVLAIARAARRWDAPRAARSIERAQPALADGLLAYVADGPPELRPHLAAWLAARPLSARHAGTARAAGLFFAVALAAIALASWRASQPAGAAARTATAPASGAGAPAEPFTIGVEIVPPSYTRRPATRSPLPADGIAQAPAGSRVTLRFSAATSAGGFLTLTAAGGAPERIDLGIPDAGRSYTLTSSIALRIAREGGAPRIVSLQARPDLPPEVELIRPAHDDTTQAPPAPFAVEAVARDDFGLAAAGLWYTLAHGRGEGMSFKNGSLPSAPEEAPGGARRMRTRVDPAALGMKAGDTLVLWAEASDLNDVTGPGVARSAARVLRWEEKMAALDLESSAARLKVEDLPLSQRELLARTERFVAAMHVLNEAARREKSLDLADDQRRIRERYGQFTRQEDGNAVELDVEEKESGEMGPPRILRLLVKAVDSMWASELALSASDPAGSIPHQKRAVKFLEDAFGLERYALRALAAPRSAVDLKKRLTGEAKGLDPLLGPAARDAAAEAARASLRALAAALFEAASRTEASPRALGDAIFSAAPGPGFDPAHEAAALYAAADTGAAARAARTLALRLLAQADGPQAPAPPAPAEAGAILDRLRALGRGAAK